MKCIYVLHAAGLHYYKIGVTSNLYKRVKTLQHACPVPLTVVWNSENIDSKLAHSIEHWLHDTYRHLRVDLPYQREWFHISHDEIKNIKAMVCKVVCSGW